MKLANLITHLPLQLTPGQRWAVLGPEVTEFQAKLRDLVGHVVGLTEDNIMASELDGLFLAGALSAAAEPITWLQELIAPLKQGATLIVIDWQADGPLDAGPELHHRFNRGKLCRLLRETGFGTVSVVVSHSRYYLIQAVKHQPPPPLHAGKFVTVAALAELPKNGMKQVELFGQPLIVANTGREIVAFAQVCPHAGHSLAKGKLRGRHIICPAHFYMWNVCTGEPEEPADEDTLPTYLVKVDEVQGLVQVALRG